METREENKQARDYNCVACRRPDKYVPKSAEDVKQVCDDCLKGVNSVKLSDGGASEKLIFLGGAMMEQIQHGSRVTIVNRFGQKSTGTAVMRGPAGWILNMGGSHGTPGIATAENVTKVTTRNPKPAWKVLG